MLARVYKHKIHCVRNLFLAAGVDEAVRELRSRFSRLVGKSARLLWLLEGCMLAYIGCAVCTGSGSCSFDGVLFC